MEAVRFTCLNSSLENADLGVNAQVRDYLQYLTYASYEVLVAFLFFLLLLFKRQGRFLLEKLASFGLFGLGKQRLLDRLDKVGRGQYVPYPNSTLARVIQI